MMSGCRALARFSPSAIRLASGRPRRRLAHIRGPSAIGAREHVRHAVEAEVVGDGRLWATLRKNRREWSTLGLPTHDDDRTEP